MITHPPLSIVRVPPTNLFPNDVVVTDFADHFDEQLDREEEVEEEVIIEGPEEGARSRKIREEIRKFNNVRIINS